MGDSAGAPLMPIYGIAEIAAALGMRRQKVAMWKTRGHLPPPDAQLASGPVWLAATIEPWIERWRGARRIGPLAKEA